MLLNCVIIEHTFPGAVTILCLQEKTSRVSVSLQSRKTLILTAFSFFLRSAAETEVAMRSAGRVAARPVTTEMKRNQILHDRPRT